MQSTLWGTETPTRLTRESELTLSLRLIPGEEEVQTQLPLSPIDPRRRSADTTSGIPGQYPLADTNTRPLDPSIRVHLPPRLGIAHPDTPARSPGLLCVTGQRTRSKILQARFSQRDRASARRVPPGVAAGEGPCRRVFYYTVHEAHPTSLSTYRSPHLHPHPTLCYLLNKTVAFPVSLSER